ncbi:MAG: hypothetical protein DRP83_00040 [Planctomycetota bacterium]|nr:MAG: hypothetical protein DRP83_00040 [Planctomycetota bacterium]
MTVHVNHDYPHEGDLQVVSENGEPLEGVTIRIFELEKFLAGETSSWVAETVTDADGNWVDTIDLEDARSWAVHFQKLDIVGPEHREIMT